jgi:3-phenylpropionate/trans-cinnamate dioxygenase ferredoxin component
MSFDYVATIGDIPDGGMVQIVVRGEPVGLYRVGENVYAIHDVCTHEEAYLTDGDFEPDDLEIECPLHGSHFNVETGEVRILPATRPVTAYEVKIDGERVLVGPEKV